MGMLDAIQSEDRIQVKYSEFYALVKGAAKAELLVNAALTEVPHKYMRCMMTGKNDLLEEYKGTGVIPEEIKGMQELIKSYRGTKLSPEQVKEMQALLKQYQDTNIAPEDLKELDDIYTEKCKQITDLQAQNTELQKQNGELKAQLEAQGDKPTQPEAADDLSIPAESEKDLQQLSGICVPASTDETKGGDGQKGKSRKQIDIGKIMALKNAGWKVKDIADEMHMEPSAVSNAIWRHNKSLEGKDNESES